MPSVFFFFFYRTCAAILHQLCTFVCNFFLAHVQMLQLSLLCDINYIIDNDDISPLHRPDYRTQKRLFMRLCFKNLWSEFSGKQIALCIQTCGIINAIVWTSNDRENRYWYLGNVCSNRSSETFYPRSEYIHRFGGTVVAKEVLCRGSPCLERGKAEANSWHGCSCSATNVRTCTSTHTHTHRARARKL